MTKNKQIKALEERVDNLEREFSRLINNLSCNEGSQLSYEEVIDLWLNGKATT